MDVIVQYIQFKGKLTSEDIILIILIILRANFDETSESIILYKSVDKILVILERDDERE